MASTRSSVQMMFHGRGALEGVEIDGRVFAGNVRNLGAGRRW